MRFNEIQPGDVLLASDFMTVILFISVEDIAVDGVKFAEIINLATGRRGTMTLDDAVMNENKNNLIILRGDQVIT